MNVCGKCQWFRNCIDTGKLPDGEVNQHLRKACRDWQMRPDDWRAALEIKKASGPYPWSAYYKGKAQTLLKSTELVKHPVGGPAYPDLAAGFRTKKALLAALDLTVQTAKLARKGGAG